MHCKKKKHRLLTHLLSLISELVDFALVVAELGEELHAPSNLLGDLVVLDALVVDRRQKLRAEGRLQLRYLSHTQPAVTSHRCVSRRQRRAGRLSGHGSMRAQCGTIAHLLTRESLVLLAHRHNRLRVIRLHFLIRIVDQRGKILRDLTRTGGAAAEGKMIAARRCELMEYLTDRLRRAAMPWRADRLNSQLT